MEPHLLRATLFGVLLALPLWLLILGAAWLLARLLGAPL